MALMRARQKLGRADVLYDVCVQNLITPYILDLGIAQLVARNFGVVEAMGSNPVTQTK